jgi:putative tryptophan/tyrosine transport system substrate-binding protein
MDRRIFVFTLGTGVVTARSGAAQVLNRKAIRIGYVGAWYSTTTARSLFDAFRQGLGDLGYVEGQNLTIDARWMEGMATDEAARLTAKLLRSKVDVLVAQAVAIPGVKAVAGSTPVVFSFSGDPVAAKFVASLARPGGNLTGMTLLSVDLASKRVELLKQAAPRASRIAILTNPAHPGEEEELRETQIGAQRLGLTVQPFAVRTVADVNAAMDAIARNHIDSIVALSNFLIMHQRYAIAEFAIKQGIPTISSWEDFAAAGNLMSYGPDLEHAWRRVATYVDKILKGAKPSDLPVEQPTKFRLVVNLKTAKALTLTIPAELLVRADRTVE